MKRPEPAPRPPAPRAFDRSELEQLLADRAHPWVSLFLPTHRTGREVRGDPTLLADLLREAESRLESTDLGSEDVQRLLAPARALLEDRDFWEHSDAGLAIYLAPERVRIHRVPSELEARVVVGDRPAVRPLLPVLHERGRYHLLAVSRNRARLFEGTSEGLEELDLGDAPRSLGEAVGREVEPQALQWHSTGSGFRNRPPATYHGHGGGVDDTETELDRYLRRLDEGVLAVLGKEARAPLVLAAVDHVAARYRRETGHRDVLQDTVPGSHDEASADELHRAAWPLLRTRFTEAAERATERYRELRGTPRAVDELEEVLPAAREGRVEVLFAERGVERNGRFVDGAVDVGDVGDDDPAAEDLIERAAREVLERGGEVFDLEREAMPTSKPVAAVLRY